MTQTTIRQQVRRSFSGMTHVAAARLAVGLSELEVMGCRGLVLEGAWRGRRFVIESARKPIEKLAEFSFDDDALTMTLPSDAEPASIVRECRRFGGRVERTFRDHVLGSFDFVIREGERAVHLVHQYHHIALCGCDGPWPNDPSDPMDVIAGAPCERCRNVSLTKPVHRARYHPLAVAPLKRRAPRP